MSCREWRLWALSASGAGEGARLAARFAFLSRLGLERLQVLRVALLDADAAEAEEVADEDAGADSTPTMAASEDVAAAVDLDTLLLCVELAAVEWVDVADALTEEEADLKPDLTVSVASPQNEMRMSTLSAWHATWTWLSSGTKKAVSQVLDEQVAPVPSQPLK